ncbi:hypothetical protein HYS29_00275 [Candidatus Microgenomates bacterium]|nr:hypothetical protein [Candidatus Microgenomates bacterium]MBI2622034.1 hypothetical protein [Candidatus Microgenomates bacterium]
MNESEKKLESKIIEVFANHFGIPKEDIKPELELEKDLNSTRLELGDFYSALENTFNIKIEPQEGESFTTVGDIINFIVDHGSFT